MHRSRIRLLAAVVAGIVVLVAIGTHFLLPPYLENRVEERLEEHGGRADVELSAVPAIRLLAGHGDRLEIEGSGLEVDFDDPDEDAFEQLNNFDEVEIDLTDVEADPFEVDALPAGEPGRRPLPDRDGRDGNAFRTSGASRASSSGRSAA